MEPDRTPRYLQSGGRPDRAGAPDGGRADPLLAHATRPQPAPAVAGRERLDQAPELRRDRPLQPGSPAPRPPRPAPRSADRRAQPTAARGRLRTSLSGAALRRGGDAAASGVARAAARGARAEPGSDRRRALEPDRGEPRSVAPLGSVAGRRIVRKLVPATTASTPGAPSDSSACACGSTGYSALKPRCCSVDRGPLASWALVQASCSQRSPSMSLRRSCCLYVRDGRCLN